MLKKLEPWLLSLLILTPIGIVIALPSLNQLWLRYSIISLFVSLIGLEIYLTKSWKNISWIGNWRKSLLTNSITIGVLAITCLYLFFTSQYPQGSEVLPDRGYGSLGSVFFYIFFYSFISSPLQELLFRGILLKSFIRAFEQKLNATTSEVLAIVLSSLVYAAMHLFYIQPWWIVLATFVGGVFWSLDYQKNRSLLVISISHAVAGLLVFLINFA